MVTAYKGFQGQLDELYAGDQAKSIEYIADIFNLLGNKYAVSASDVGSALERSASSLSLAGNTIQESAAMATGITEVTQDSERAGNALKILSMRLRGTSAKEMESLGEETDGLVETTSKLRDTILSLTNNKVDIQIDENTYKKPYQIMKEISTVFNDLSDKQQASLLETIAGKSRANDISALINNWKNVENAMNDATNAEGSARKENDIYMTHIEARTKVLKASLQSLSNNVLNSDAISNTLGWLNNIINLTDKIVDNVGLLPPILGVINGYLMVSKGTNIFSSTLTLLKDIPNYLSGVAVGFSGLKGMGGIGNIKQLSADVNAIKERNKLIRQGVDYLDANTIAMTNASPEAKTLAQNAGNSAVKMDDLAKKTNTTTSSLRAATIATNLLNAAISIGVTAAISAVIYGLNKFASLQGEQAEKALSSYEKANEKLDDTKSKIGELNSLVEKYNELNSKNNLNKDGSLNNNGRKEALEIQNQIVDLIGNEANNYDLVNGKLDSRIDKLKEVQKILAEEKIDDSVNAMNKSINAKNKVTTGEKWNLWDSLTGKYKDYGVVYYDKKFDNNVASELDKQGVYNFSRQVGRNSGRKDMTLRSDINPITGEKISTAEEQIALMKKYQEAFKSAKRNTSSKKNKEKYQNAIDDIQEEINKFDDLVVKSSKQKANAISDLIDYNINNNNKFSNQKLTNATEYSNYRDKLAKEISNNKDIKSAIDKKEIKTKDIYKQIDAYMSGVDEFSRGYNEWILHQNTEGIDKTKEIKKSFEKNKKGYNREINSFNAWVNKLNSKEVDYVYQISLDTESAKYDLEEWQRQLEYARNGSLTDKTSLEDFYGVFGDTSDDSFSSKIQNYQTELNSLNDVLSKFKSGELTENDLTDLMIKYPKLINYTDNLDVGINKLIDDITGSAKDGTGIVKLFNEQIEILGKDTAGGKKMAELRDRIIEASKVAKDGITLNITTETNNLNTIATALSESVNGSGLSDTSYDAITNLFKNVKGFDPSKVFEKTANGIRLNVDELEKLQNEYTKTKRATEEAKLDILVNKYNALTKEINTTTDAVKRAELVNKQTKLREEINNVSKLITQYDGLTSSYNRWIRAKSTENEGKIYDEIYAGMEEMNELYKKGWTGIDDFKEYVRMLSGRDLTNATNKQFETAYKELLPKLRRYTTESTTGLQNFVKDLNKYDKNLASVDKNGNWNLNIQTKDYERISKQLKISKKYVEAIVRKLPDAGFKLNIDGLTDGLKLSDNYLDKCNKKINNMKLSSYKFNFGSTDLENLDKQISIATGIYNKFKDKNGKINLTLEGADEAKKILETLLKQRQQIANSKLDIFKVDTKNVKNVNTQIKQAISNISKTDGLSNKIKYIKNAIVDASKILTPEYQINLILDTLSRVKNLYTDINRKKSLGKDTSKLEKELNAKVKYLNSLSPEVKTELSLDTKSVKSIIHSIENMDAEILTKFNVDNKEIVKFKKESHDINAVINYKVNDSAVNTFERTRTINGQKITDTKKGKVGTRTIVNKDGSKVVMSTVADGTAKSFSNGSAFAQGNWGLKNSGTALVGELGKEILVRNGKFYTIGDKSAELIKYKKNDIIE